MKQNKEAKMSIEKHLAALEAKHAALDVALEEEGARPLPDQTKISELKKQKLKIKEEIAEIKGSE